MEAEAEVAEARVIVRASAEGPMERAVASVYGAGEVLELRLPCQLSFSRISDWFGRVGSGSNSCLKMNEYTQFESDYFAV